MQELENASMSVTELAQRLYLERSSVSRLVDGLVKENLIRRDVNPANRRETILSLTGKGENTVRQVREQSLRFFEKVLQDLSENDRKQIMDGFQKFTAALLRHKGRQKS